MKQYLEDLTPQEVIDRMTKGEQVHYTDSKGNDYLYVLYKGVTIRIDKSTGKCDGFNRSIYSTCGAYFETEDTLRVRIKHHYRTRHGKTVYITSKQGIWYDGIMFLEDSTIEYSWNDKGEFYPDSKDPRDLVVELD